MIKNIKSIRGTDNESTIYVQSIQIIFQKLFLSIAWF